MLAAEASDESGFADFSPGYSPKGSLWLKRGLKAVARRALTVFEPRMRRKAAWKAGPTRAATVVRGVFTTAGAAPPGWASA